MGRYEIKAYAKINLGLDVIGRLENGYHEVRMIMQNLELHDTLYLEKIPEGIAITTDAGELPTDKGNLIYRAAALFTEYCNLKEGVRIHLEKQIPIAAGMAGGSADAASTLLGMNELFACGCSKQELMELGVRIGADVPYCILGGTALAEGIGEKLTSLRPMPDCHILVAKPDINVSTKYVYEHLDAEGVTAHPDIDGMLQAIEEGSLAGVVERLDNVLERVTGREYPVIAEIEKRMLELGADGSIMSGSGPTVFGIYRDPVCAEKAFSQLREDGLAPQVFLTRPCAGMNV